jgi:hypothetical protein
MSENTNLKIIIVLLIASLLLALLGVYDKYNLLRWEVLGITSILACISFASRRNYWGIVFVAFGLLFNPIEPFSLSRNEWMIADVLLVSVLAVWFWDFFTNYHKGLLFERYVQGKFPGNEWIMVNATKDLHKKFRRFVESDAHPDFVFRKRGSGKTIAVECKYRSEYVSGTRGDVGVWWKNEQGKRYVRYGQENNTPVYIAIGVGGNPQSPKMLSFVPLELIQKQYYRFIPKEILEQHQTLPQ